MRIDAPAMETDILFMLPMWEPATATGTKHLKEQSKKAFLERGFAVFSAEDENAVRDYVFAILNKGVKYLSLVGHGNPDVVTGHEYAVILQRDQLTADIVKGRVFVLLSCSVGAGLAQWLVDNGALAVLAYTRDFIFSSNSTDDRHFFDPHCLFDIIMSKAMTTGEAYAASQKAWQESYESADEFLKPWILWNKKSQKLFGRDDVCVIPSESPEEPEEPKKKIKKWWLVAAFVGIVILAALML